MKNCLPDPEFIICTVLIPVFESLKLLCNVIVDASTILAKYIELVLMPVMTVAVPDSYWISSFALKLWDVENPILSLTVSTPPVPLVKAIPARKGTLCWTNFRLTFASAPSPLPPLIVTIGWSV